jgi:hypothetical protein
MALALPLVLGLAASLLVGGSNRAIAELRFRGVALFYGALLLQVVAFPFGPLPWHTPGSVATILWIASYGLVFAAAMLNRSVAGVPVVLVGMACNLLAVLANGGHMPVREGAMRAAGFDYVVHNNSALLSHPRLPFLIDRWPAPAWIPTANVFSVGDVVIAVGAFVFAFAATGAAARLLRIRVRGFRPAVSQLGDE